MAAVPDFGALSQQQQAANDDATRRTTWSQRPDQSNALGGVTWNQDPTGRWISNSYMNGGTQSLFDQSIAGQQNLGSQISGGLNTSGLIDFGNPDPNQGLMGWGNTDLTRGAVAMPDSGFGATQSVIDAWNRLQQPGLDKDADAQRARMAAQGITAGSVIGNLGEKGISDAAGTARDKAILAGTTEYGNVFNRGLQSRQQTVAENTAQATMQNSMRGQQFGENLQSSQLRNQERAAQFGERQTGYDAALRGTAALGTMRDSLNPNKWNADVKAGAAYVPQTVYGAAQDTFAANRQNENADIAQSNANRAATTSAINTGLNAVGGLSGLGSAASGLWDWGSKNIWGGGGSGDFVSDPGAVWASQQPWN